jgi:hypothetical protein
MEPQEYFNNPAQSEKNVITSPDPEEQLVSGVQDLFQNFAENDDIVEETKKRIGSLFSNISGRAELEDIWKDNDMMYRVKPDASKDDSHRANEATGVFHISVNQLVAMAFKTFTDNTENYKYGFRAIPNDEVVNEIRAKNAEIMTALLNKSLSSSHFKRNLKRVLVDIYKNGTGVVGIPWDKQVVDLDYRDKDTGQRASKQYVVNNLPKFEFVPLDQIWVDENIDDFDGQPAIFIRKPISWTKLISDRKKNNVKIFDTDGAESLRDTFGKYLESSISNEFNTPKADRFDNADRTFQDRTGEKYKHWFVWINLPINTENGKWDKDGAETRFRVRILGDPESCDVIEIRKNMFPGGVPFFVAHQTEDDIGFYHVSLGEKVKSYYDQICIAVNQLIDNRSKNVRRPFLYDPVDVEVDKYDWGHSNAIPVSGGNISSKFQEMQISDMTATIMPTISYCEQKIREIMNTTDAVMGQAMGGRTSASEYMGAKAAATTPIFSDMASIEDAIIGEYMRRFCQYIHVYMTPEDIVDQIGVVGAEFQFDNNDIYTIELHGVAEAMDKASKIQNLLQLYQMTQDASARARIMLRIAQAMGVENPNEFVTVPAKDQAIKAALWENNEILLYSQWDEPEQGEMHDVHIPIHQQALWMAQRDNNPNAQMMIEHISKTKQLQKQAEALGGAGSLPLGNGQPETSRPPTPGEESGWQISGELGNINAGSPIPAQQPAMPGG